MKTTGLKSFQLPAWREQMEHWRAAGLITTRLVAPTPKEPKTNRIRRSGLLVRMRAYAAVNPPFTLLTIMKALQEKSRQRAMSGLGALCRNGELVSSSAGQGRQGPNVKPLFEATDKLKV